MDINPPYHLDPSFVIHPTDALGTDELPDSDKKGTFQGYYDPTSTQLGIEWLCESLGLDLHDPEYAPTPVRVDKWFMGFARKPNYDGNKEDFLSVTFESPHQELIMVSNLRFISLCPHHLLPYSGTAAIGYLPGAISANSTNFKVVGLSKLARALWYWTYWPVKQEDSTSMIADALMRYLNAEGAMVVLQAQHACMGLRGVMQENHQTTTSATRGAFRTDANGIRQEFIQLMRLSHGNKD